MPEEVIRAGVVTEKEGEFPCCFTLNLMTSDSTQDEKFVYNFADINILPELEKNRRCRKGQKSWETGIYAMRIWLNPDPDGGL